MHKACCLAIMTKRKQTDTRGGCSADLLVRDFVLKYLSHMRASRWRRQPVRQVFELFSNFEAARACSVRKLFNPGINMQLNAVLLCSFVRIVFKPMQLSFQRKIEAASGSQSGRESNPFQTSKSP